MTVKAVRKITFESLLFDAEFNARKDYEGIEELAESIKREGLLQPIGVTAKKGPDSEGQKYFIVYGFRRYLAITKIREELGDDAFSQLDVVIVEGNQQMLREKNLIENLDRKSLKPFEVAGEIEKMVNAKLEQRDIAKRLGRPQSWVSYHYKAATKLGPAATNEFQKGNLTLEQALHIADIPEDDQDEVVEAVVSAQSRKEARQIAKEAAKESGTRRTYSNKGRPTAKNLTQYVEDASFDGTSNGITKVNAAFQNGVAAGLKVALGDADFSELAATVDYCDTSYSSKKAKADPPKKKKGRKKKSSSNGDTTTAKSP